ncbi:MAG: hypothetical protein MPW14_25435 (plasmid) [Candidatus Manganitrophus sp.]|nr:MAG: hypothetical protein MPW14_25435 [Candidatus Manganitrophus sp.]
MAHGSEDDQANSRWLASMNHQIEKLRKDPHCSKLKAIYPVTVREDWPEKRKEEVAKLKEMIKEGKKSGRVLLISNRLRGCRPLQKPFWKGSTSSRGRIMKSMAKASPLTQR